MARLLACATLSLHSLSAATTTVGLFTGGDPGEGLDLQGNFTYAINIGPDGPAGKVGDANFSADNVAGVTIDAQNQIGLGAWLVSTYGDTANDDNLEKVMGSIRWSAAPAVVTVRLRVETGIDYKLQILEGENCCIGRGFNVLIEDQVVAESLMPGVLQSPGGDFAAEKLVNGVVITHEFKAADNELVIVFDGPGAPLEEIGDRNAIVNGLTLERISPITDNDNDGLRDDWEIQFFNDLAQTPAGDFDSDGLTNQEEYTLQIDPSNEDSDGDTLTDGAEAKTHKTDPTKTDSDGDGLRDGAEVTLHQSDPAKPDTDADTFSDFMEVSLFTNPNSAQSTPKNTTIGLFTGGDPGEGLDLQGNIVYALDHAAAGVLGGQAGDAYFGEEIIENVNVISGYKTALWNADINYGESPADLVLADVMGSISWSAAADATGDVTVEMGNLTPGSIYKLQLLFAEQAWPRGFDVYMDGLLVADDFSPVFYQGGGFPLRYPDDRGVVLTHTFVARTNNVSFVLDGRGTTTPEFTDHNAIINGSTLELVGPSVDSDNDTLPDLWEETFFGNLAQTGAQDTDNDSLSNSVEFADGSDPANADRDGDGLTDSEEKASGTRSGFADTDRDGLTDSAEVKIHGTNPTLSDTDEDGLSDNFEIRMGSDPKNPVIEDVTQGVTIGAFTGGDEGEGLDLDGDFTYAFSILPNTSNTGMVRNATFTSENVPGVTVSQATSMAANWYVADFGDTENDNTLEKVISNIRHGGGGANIILGDLVPGRKYKLQLIFGERCCSRGMDVFVDGKRVADEFAPFMIMGEINNPLQAAVITYELTARTNQIIIQTIGGAAVTTEEYPDKNPIINAVTLENLGGGLVAPRIQSVSRTGGFAVTISSTAGTNYTLQYKEKITDASWTDVTSVAATGNTTTLTDTDTARQSRATGFWRVRAQ